MSKTFDTHNILRRERKFTLKKKKSVLQVSIKPIQTKALKIHNLGFGNTDTAIPHWQRLNTVSLYLWKRHYSIIPKYHTTS